ncbi:MAG TPA: PHB depolymerase family esterase, partial [Longimicrobiales bacterium]|nr:PHB depolymerase family esterase [Longimicrobiales bacterium]
TWLLHAPPQVRNGEPLPVVLAFHGGGGNARGFEDYAGLDAVADREGFLAVYPEGTGRLNLRTWNAGPRCCGYALDHDVDDVGFIRAVVAGLERRTAVDASRVYATGHSNGAGMSYRLALEAPDLVAAVAPVAGAAMGPTEGPATPVPILHIHSVDDPRALYEGGEGPPFPLTSRTVVHRPVGEVLAFWAGVNGCPGAPRAVETLHAPAEGPDAGQWAERLVWEGCASAPLVHWRLHGVGHAWPGHRSTRRLERLVGPSTGMLDAAEEVWSFFRGLPASPRRRP